MAINPVTLELLRHAFDSVAEQMTAALTRASLADNLPATVLIHGGPGCGKQALALWLAQLRLCEAADAEGPCGSCKSCRFATRLQHPDIHWYFPLPRPKGVSGPEKLARALEEARQEQLAEYRRNSLRPTRGAEVRGLYLAQILDLRRAAQKRPAVGDEQVFVVGDAEHLVPQEASPEAANALLKLLEEPPGGCRFVLTSSRPESLLETIRSRSLELHLPPLSAEEVAAFLVRHAAAEPAAARSAARAGDGSIGLALGHLDPEGEVATRRQDAFDLLKSAMTGRRADLYALALSYAPSGARALVDVLADVQGWIRDLSVAALDTSGGNPMGDLADVRALGELVGKVPLAPPQAAAAVDRVEWARTLAEANVNPQLLMSSLLLDLHETFKGDPSR